MSLERNKLIYRNFIEEVFNHGRLDLLEVFLDPSYFNHDAPPGTPVGIEGVSQIVTVFRVAFPNMKVSIEDQIAEGDKVCSLATTRGVHKGPIFGIPPTGKTIVMTGLTMVRIVNDKLMESWVKNDMAGLMNQLQTLPRSA
jgi:predicted ester cyclase